MKNYYPFGMPMPGRSLSLSNYRFGFITQEKVDEISGKGNHNTAKFWEYDTRLGRRWNIDPKSEMSVSSLSCFNNNPILNVDILGDKWKDSKKDQAVADRQKTIYSKKQASYKKQKDDYMTKLDNAEKAGDTKAAGELSTKATEAADGEAEMYLAQTELDAMRDDSKMTFTFNNKGSAGNGVIDDKITWSGTRENPTIIIPFYADALGLTIHESKHAAQVLEGYLRPNFEFGKNDIFIGTSVFTEKQAYIRQFFASQFSMPFVVKNSKEITQDKIINVRDGTGSQIYQYLKGSDEWGVTKAIK